MQYIKRLTLSVEHNYLDKLDCNFMYIYRTFDCINHFDVEVNFCDFHLVLELFAYCTRADKSIKEI